MFMTGLRRKTSDECWESFITATSRYIRKLVKKFQKKKKVWAEFLRVVYYLLVKLSMCDGGTVFNGRSLQELYNHCNGVLSSTNRLIHDVLPDPNGRGIDLLLEQLSTRTANGLWLVSLHRRDGVANQLVLPSALPSRAKSIEVAKLINSEYGHGVDRHAHIVHICPWARNYCRCKPLQGLPIKQRSRPSRPWRAIGEQHFINLIEYLLRNPRQLCIFEVGCSPVYIALPSGKYLQLL